MLRCERMGMIVALMDDPQQARQALETALLNRLRTAEAAYKVAKAEHDRLTAVLIDVGVRNPDGALAMEQALELTRTLEEYAKALKAFTDFAVNKLPGE